MGKRKYVLDTRILTVFFFVAIAFVALGFFMGVRMATGQLQESLGSSLEQRAIQTKAAVERYVADQIVHLRLIPIDPQVRQAVSGPRPSLGGGARRREQAWAWGADAKSTAPLLESSLAARLRDFIAVRPVLKLLQIVDADGRLGGPLQPGRAWSTPGIHEISLLLIPGGRGSWMTPLVVVALLGGLRQPRPRAPPRNSGPSRRRLPLSTRRSPKSKPWSRRRPTQTSPTLPLAFAAWASPASARS